MEKEQFIIRQIIGEGASSTVYRAFDRERSRNIALKVFSARRRNEHENEKAILDVLGKSDNEHVAKFYGQIGRNTYAFELCECNLISFINEHEMNLRGIKKIIRMILLGLEHIHRCGIIHRDMKLGNILVKGDCIKLCDFGLSCFISQNDYCYCGTKDYLAPEMEAVKEGSGGTYDQLIDVYAVGVIYITLISRKKDSDLYDIGVDGNVRDLIMKMTNEDPRKRCTARGALEHSSFEELFCEIPRFETLRDMNKVTKYGRISKGIRDGGCYIEIEYASGEYKSDGEQHTLRIESIGTMQRRRYKIKIDKNEINKVMLTNSMLKHFNYLCSYFKIMTESTVTYRDNDGKYMFRVMANGEEHLEWDGIRAKKKEEEIVIMDDKNGLMAGEMKREAVKGMFERFKKRQEEASSFSIEQKSSMKILLSADNLIKKYEFVERLGWAMKSGLTFVLLLNSGQRYIVDVEEQTVSDTNGAKMRVEEAPMELLVQVRELIRKFV